MTDSVLMREAMLIRHQMFDELVLAREASAWNAARTRVEVTVEARGGGMSSSDVTGQIAFASIMLEARMVGTVMALADDVKAEAWSEKWGKWFRFWIASGQKIRAVLLSFWLEAYLAVVRWSDIAVRRLSWSKRYAG